MNNEFTIRVLLAMVNMGPLRAEVFADEVGLGFDNRLNERLKMSQYVGVVVISTLFFCVGVCICAFARNLQDLHKYLLRISHFPDLMPGEPWVVIVRVIGIATSLMGIWLFIHESKILQK